jgi:hypothetical protein
MITTKFTYEPLYRETINGSRKYATPDGEKLPSVTTILDFTKSEESKQALQNWLLDRLETYFDFDGRMNNTGTPTNKIEISITSIAKLADIAKSDSQFITVGELYRNDPAFKIEKLITELIEAESVPHLPILRYKVTGLRKRLEWEHTWELQRQEDTPPPPP